MKPRQARSANAAGRTRGAYFSPASPRIFAHRGLAIDVPENTLLAFVRALAVGANYLETDVHASKDQIAIISHDPFLTRLASRNVAICDLTFDELSRIQLGSGQTFCSLAQALDAFPDARFNIDVKSADAVEPTARAVRAAGAESRVLVTSFSESRRAAINRALPQAATSASAVRFAIALVCAKVGLGFAVRKILRDVDAVQVPMRALWMPVTTPWVIAALHRAGVEIHVWTINDVAIMAELLDLGVDGIVTDRADLALELLATRQ